MQPEAAALAALRAHLPGWVGFAPLALVLLAALLAAVGAHLAVSIALRPFLRVPADAHWTERARLGWPARATAASAPMLAAIVLGLGFGELVGPLSLVPPTWVGLLAGVAAFVAAYPQIERVSRRVCGRHVPARERLAGQGIVFLVLRPHGLIVLLAVVLMPTDPLGATIGGALVLALLTAVAFGAGLRLAGALGLARPADARLARLVDACAEKVGVHPRRVWLLRYAMVNAFALPRSGQLAVTEEAAAKLTDDELASVIAHELGHLGEPRRVQLVRTVGLFAVFPLALFRPITAPIDDPLDRLLVLLLVLLFVLLVLRLVRRTSRKMEERADAVAHAHDDEEGGYARALERLHTLNLIPAVMGSKRMAHPHLYDRLIATGRRPDYPRPAAPPRGATRFAVLALLTICLGGVGVTAIGPFVVDPAQHSIVALAVTGGSTDTIGGEGRARLRAGHLEEAIPFYRAAAALDPGSVYWQAELARLLAGAGHCHEAMRAAGVAMGRAHPENHPPLDYMRRVLRDVERSCLPRPELPNTPR